MTNFPLTEESQLRDVESINLLAQAKENGREAWAWNGIIHKGRENARTPMQWDDTQNGGFSSGTPWIGINPDFYAVNVKKAIEDENSILHFYRELIALRGSHDALRYGDFRMLLPDDPVLFAYERGYEEERIIVCCNFHDGPVKLPSEIRGEPLISSGAEGRTLMGCGLIVLKINH